MNIQWVPSPNYWEGRTKPITTIVLHWIVGTLATADGVFENIATELSAHYGIENETIHQYVKDENTAFHAIGANPYSIGIEHSAAPNRPASQATINTSAQLVRSLCLKHNIPIDRAHIIKHSDVVATQCPGTLPIDEIINKAKEGEEEMPNSGDAVNYIRGLKGDPSYNPTQAEIDQAMKTSYKDWSYILGFPNSGDATNFIKSEKGDDYKPTQAEINKAMSPSFKSYAYKYAGVQNSDYTPINQTVYVKK